MGRYEDLEKLREVSNRAGLRVWSVDLCPNGRATANGPQPWQKIPLAGSADVVSGFVEKYAGETESKCHVEVSHTQNAAHTIFSSIALTGSATGESFMNMTRCPYVRLVVDDIGTAGEIGATLIGAI